MSKGSAIRAELNQTFQAKCVNCRKIITTDTGHQLEEKQYWVWGLMGLRDGKKMVFPTCNDCYESGWRPSEFGLI